MPQSFSMMQVLDRLHRPARADQRQPTTQYTTDDVSNVSLSMMYHPSEYAEYVPDVPQSNKRAPGA